MGVALHLYNACYGISVHLPFFPSVTPLLSIHLCCHFITYGTQYVNHPVMLIKWLSYEVPLFARCTIELDLC